MKISLAICLLPICLFLASWGTAGAVTYNTCLNPSDGERLFLDRLMRAESGGRLFARNPRSSALGPFQFLRNTFLDIVRRNMPELMEGKSETDILKLRTHPQIARDAALLYTRENAAFFAARGISPSAAMLRLAFFIGPANAHKVISAKPQTRVSSLISDPAREANPILDGMTVGQLLERARLEADNLSPLPIPIPFMRKHDIVAKQEKPLPIPAIASELLEKPKIEIKCNLQRPSCKKWLALAELRLKRREAHNSASSKPAAGKAQQQE